MNPSSPRLSVNLNKVALLRNARDLDLPSVLDAARTCLAAGAHGITVHPRPDERHIRPRDVYDLAALLAAYPGAEFNVEGNPFAGAFLPLVMRVRPDQCTLVPDAPGQRTSDHGWDLRRHAGRLRLVITALQAEGIRVSLFMDPDPEQIRLAAALGIERVELYTEPYARAFARGDYGSVLDGYAAAARQAQAAGLGVNAGHDLNRDNLGPFCAIGGILEVSIGHALIADALNLGFPATVEAYLHSLLEPVA